MNTSRRVLEYLGDTHITYAKTLLQLCPLRTDVVRPAKSLHALLVTPLRGLGRYADGLIHGGHYTHCHAVRNTELRRFLPSNSISTAALLLRSVCYPDDVFEAKLPRVEFPT